MRTYELIFIVHPDLDEDALKEIVERVQGWIAEGKGQVNKVDLWGKRRLAYPIRKQTEGQYVLVEAQMDPAYCATLDRNLRFLEPVMRHSLVVVED